MFIESNLYHVVSVGVECELNQIGKKMTRKNIVDDRKCRQCTGTYRVIARKMPSMEGCKTRERERLAVWYSLLSINLLLVYVHCTIHIGAVVGASSFVGRLVGWLHN